MGKQLFIGLAVEGSTDAHFLSGVIRRTFEQIVIDECEQDVDIDLFPLKFNKTGKTFPEFVASAAKIGVSTYGILTLAIHTDSDKETLKERMADKIIPAEDYLKTLPDEEYCKVLTPVIPMKMMEAWMLADTQLLKDEIGTTMSDAELCLSRDPETVADPKDLISKAIITAQSAMPRKRRTLTIGDLYQIIGDTISLTALSHLASYQAFRNAARDSLIKLHYLH